MNKLANSWKRLLIFCLMACTTMATPVLAQQQPSADSSLENPRDKAIHDCNTEANKLAIGLGNRNR